MEFFERYKDDMKSYVKKQLEQYDSEVHPWLKIRLGRYEHILRVFKWMERLYSAYPDKDAVDREALYIATLFHDIGYCDPDPTDHAKSSAVYCRKYLTEKNYPQERIGFICDIISRHSDKKAMHNDIPAELVLLMEADLLDEIGAQGLVLDVWIEAAREKDISFRSILAHMEKYTLAMMQDSPMRTDEAIKIWNEKKKLTEGFVRAYREDIRIYEEL